MILVGYERHGGNLASEQFAALLELEEAPRHRVRGRDIAAFPTRPEFLLERAQAGEAIVAIAAAVDRGADLRPVRRQRTRGQPGERRHAQAEAREACRRGMLDAAADEETIVQLGTALR